jgi:hypothetical protein
MQREPPILSITPALMSLLAAGRWLSTAPPRNPQIQPTIRRLRSGLNHHTIPLGPIAAPVSCWPKTLKAIGRPYSEITAIVSNQVLCGARIVCRRTHAPPHASEERITRKLWIASRSDKTAYSNLL